jgi:deoxyribose-phosphate aldolase
MAENKSTENKAENKEYVNRYEQVLKEHAQRESDEQVKEICAKILEKSAENNTEEVKRFLLSSVELTSLKTEDSEESILRLVEKVNAFDDQYPQLPNFATICVYPCYAATVADNLEADGVEIAVVSAGFPSSQTFIEIKTTETALALKDGATEVDIVQSVGKLLVGDYEGVADEIIEIKEMCGERKLKVILETGVLKTADAIKKSSVIALYSGADFIKTSTGKVAISATPEAVYVMCCALKEYYNKTGEMRGIKVAGGLNTIEDAVNYYTIVKEVLGEKWLCKDGFRLGTSRLANLIINDLLGEQANVI